VENIRQTTTITVADCEPEESADGNMLASSQFLQWLELGLDGHQAVRKMIPPTEVLEERLKSDIDDLLRTRIRERILRNFRFADQVEEAKQAIRPQLEKLTIDRIVADELQHNPEQNWTDSVRASASSLVDSYLDGK